MLSNSIGEVHRAENQTAIADLLQKIPKNPYSARRGLTRPGDETKRLVRVIIAWLNRQTRPLRAPSVALRALELPRGEAPMVKAVAVGSLLCRPVVVELDLYLGHGSQHGEAANGADRSASRSADDAISRSRRQSASADCCAGSLSQERFVGHGSHPIVVP